MYPSRFQLSELTAHLVSLLERRRGAFEAWDEKTEAALVAEARQALGEVHVAFRELADDEPYWARLEKALLTVALPRYLRLAREQDALERRRFGVWRGGDFIARAAYAGAGLVLAAVVWRTGLPKWIEPLPLSFFLFGPLVPDLQGWFARRRYRKTLATLVEEMQHEQADASSYQPLGLEAPSPISELGEPDQAKAPAGQQRTK